MTGDYAASYLPWILIPIVCWLMPYLSISRVNPNLALGFLQLRA